MNVARRRNVLDQLLDVPCLVHAFDFGEINLWSLQSIQEPELVGFQTGQHGFQAAGVFRVVAPRVMLDAGRMGVQQSGHGDPCPPVSAFK